MSDFQVLFGNKESGNVQSPGGAFLWFILIQSLLGKGIVGGAIFCDPHSGELYDILESYPAARKSPHLRHTPIYYHQPIVNFLKKEGKGQNIAHAHE
jgi:hypothetical protein